jgi:hypothetical protein
MTLSGLDSIALAVAHLERVEASQEPAQVTTRPSLFMNQARVVSTEYLDQATEAPPMSWNYFAAHPVLPPTLPNHSNVLHQNNTVMPTQTTAASAARRCSSSSTSSSPKKKSKTSITPPRNKQYKNLLLLFDMAPYPIPKDAHSDAVISNTEIQEDDVLLGRKYR